MKKYKIGYTTGVYDMFHIGHLNLLKKAKEQCEYLIVGVTIDELVSYKNKEAIIPFEERMEIVNQISYVDQVVPQKNMNKMEAYEAHPFDVMFVGSDWQGSDTWNQLEQTFAQVGVAIQYLPYTTGTSSTALRSAIQRINSKETVK
ncbi:adenylyltransferase/cytidyltransferase family protein [Listeria grandensis]|uniref:adenylyltransferase/cytidyltransferase family protein n=1 Tax=Listeria grandensis TaxID=1494963 RepID=UPI00164E2E04|nr:adenylyltransferase/cytidyltransferase family protein [Listeria grandensis]MBC6315239.1 adenylyltransferase/cytidyltransferase family protein [Listeria grandensis]